jgi:hypothetical protein
MSARVCLAVMAIWLAGCHVDRTVPNAQLRCKQDSDCPGGLTCQAVTDQLLVCCGKGQPCTLSDAGTSSGGTGGGAGGTVGGGGGVGGGTSDGGGGQPPTDGPCAPQCTLGMLRCDSGGGRRCEMAPDGCLVWGTSSAGIPCPGLQLIDDGIEERDVSVQCAGNLCLIGGITP